MSLSIVETYAEELQGAIGKIIEEQGTSKQLREIVEGLTLFVVSNNLNIKAYIFDEQYSYIGKPIEKIKDIVNSTVDFLFMLLDHRDFVEVDLTKLESTLKVGIFEYLEQKINDQTLNKDNFDEFISYIKKTFDLNIVLDIIRIRITDDHEKKEEFKALLEYMIFTGRTHVEEDEFDRLQSSINFRLNLLKNYNIEYFSKQFFLLKNHAKYLPDELHSDRYFYPKDIIKEMKNLVLMIERGETHTLHVQHEARNLIKRQLDIIRQNQSKLQELQETRLKEKVD